MTSSIMHVVCRVVNCCLSYLFDFDRIHGPSEPISQRDGTRNGTAKTVSSSSILPNNHAKTGDLDSNESQLRFTPYQPWISLITSCFVSCLGQGSKRHREQSRNLKRVLVDSGGWVFRWGFVDSCDGTHLVQLGLFTASTMQQPCSSRGPGSGPPFTFHFPSLSSPCRFMSLLSFEPMAVTKGSSVSAGSKGAKT
jgi:hypothetical protein